jgi:primosomal protein N' (replication factor Y)
MIAKGLDFPRLTVAGVIAADTLLNLPDLRAAERTFQLLTQFIGRAGRRDKRGTAIIQTYNPENFAILASAAQDYQKFYETELGLRALHDYPPFKKLLRLLFSSTDTALLDNAALAVAGYLKELCREFADEVEILGPAAAPWEKIKDRYRRQILLKCDAGLLPELRKIVAAAWQKTQKEEDLPPDIRLHIDIEPLQMM